MSSSNALYRNSEPSTGRCDAAAQARDPSKPHRYSRWRAKTLILVYVLFAAHIVHWRFAGRTLAPLELSEVMYTLELGIVTAGFVFMAADCGSAKPVA